MSRSLWAKNLTITPRQIAVPTTDIAIGNLIKMAEGQGRRVRAIGSGWSFTDITYTNDVLVDMSRFNRVLGFIEGGKSFFNESLVLQEAIPEHILGLGHKLVHVQAGITIRSLYWELDKKPHLRYGIERERPSDGIDPSNLPDLLRPGDEERGRWALPTMGGAGGQTLVGAISTGTHGGDIHLPPIADCVRAIHLIGPGGIHHWIEPYKYRLTVPEQLLRVMPMLKSETIHYDDDWFNAALVSVGNLGIITDLIIDVREQFFISQQVAKTNLGPDSNEVPLTWRQIRPLLEMPNAFEDGGLFSPRVFPLGIKHPAIAAGLSVTPVPRAIEIFINPYRVSDDYHRDPLPDRRCIVISRAEAIFSEPFDETAFDQPVEPLEGRSIFQDIFDELHKLHDAWTIIRIESGGPGTVMDEINGIIDGFSEGRSEFEGFRRSYRITDTYDYLSDPLPIVAMELAITTEGNQHIQLLDRLFEIVDQGILEGKKCIAGMSLRFTRPSKALLSMQHAQKITRESLTCHIEIYGLKEANAVGHIDHSGNMEGRTDEFMVAFEAAVYELGGRIHWGQLHRLDRARVEAAYSSTLHTWRRVRTELVSFEEKTTLRSSKTFSNWFSQRCGLESYTEVLTAVTGGIHDYDVFGVDERGNVLHHWWEGEPRWEKIANPFPDGDRFLGPLTSASWGSGRVDLFGLNSKGEILQFWQEKGQWQPPRTLGRPSTQLIGPLAVTSYQSGHYQIFGLAPDGNIWRIWWDDAIQFSVWENIGNPFPNGNRFYGNLTAVSHQYSTTAPNGADYRIDLFGLGKSGGLLHLQWDAFNPQDDWQPKVYANGFPEGDRFTGPITVVSWGPDQWIVLGMGLREHVLQIRSDTTPIWGVWNNNFSVRINQRVGPLYPYGEPNAANAPYQFPVRNGLQDRFVGPISAIKMRDTVNVFGFGESSDILRFSFDRQTAQSSWKAIGNGWQSPL